MKYTLLTLVNDFGDGYETRTYRPVIIHKDSLERMIINEIIFEEWFKCDTEPDFLLDNPYNGYRFHGGDVTCYLESITYLNEADFELLYKYIG